MEEKKVRTEVKVNSIDIIKHNAIGFQHCSSKFKSVTRAISRGLVSPTGYIYPKRPFSNRANTCNRKGKHSRKMNELKKTIYEQFRY